MIFKTFHHFMDGIARARLKMGLRKCSNELQTMSILKHYHEEDAQKS